MPDYARSMDKTWSSVGTSPKLMGIITMDFAKESDWRTLASRINDHLMERRNVDDRDKREILGNGMIATVIAAIFGAIFLFIACIGLMIGLFNEFGAAYGAIANIIWISGFLYFCYRVFMRIVAALRRLELLQYLNQAERKKLLDEEMAKMKEEQELEALRKKSRLNFCKPRTSKVQGQE